MNKKFLPLILAAGLVSALLLFAGTALMDRLSPVYAARLPALFAGSSAKNMEVKDGLGANISIQVASDDLGTSAGTPVAILTVTADASDTPEPLGTPAPQGTSSAGNPQGAAVTIANLADDPAKYRGMLVSVSGIATQLNGDKFLLNDGTGQIIIDLEDDLVKIVVANGSQVTVLGQFKVRNDGLEIDACVYNGGSGNVQLDGCENEHPNGDDKGGLRVGSDDSSGSGSGSGSDDSSGSGSNSGSGSDDSSGSGSNSGSGSSGSGKGGHADPTPHP